VISSLAEEDNFIWVGTNFGLVKLDKTTGIPTFYNKSNSGLPNNSINSIAIDGSGLKWIGTRSGLAKFDGTNWTIYNTSNSGLPDNYVYSIAIDGSGNKWIGLYGDGMAKFDGLNWTKYNKTNSGLPNNYVSSLAIDERGFKWICTDGGLAVFNENGFNVSVKRNLPAETGVCLFPNPTLDAFQVKGIEGKAILSLSDINGKLLLTKGIKDNETVSLSSQPNGIYIVRITSAKGVVVRKLVKE